MPRYKGRSISACSYCRSQKVKCSGDNPCVRCRSANKTCIFAHESGLRTSNDYIKSLENEIIQLRQSLANSRGATRRPEQETPVEEENYDDTNKLVNYSTTEHFVGKLKSVYCGQTSASPAERTVLSTPTTHLDVLSGESDEHPVLTKYTYVPLDGDDNDIRVLVKLPTHSYAVYLLQQFESFVGSDYHWFRKQEFRKKMEAAYHPSQSQPVDKTWLSCFSVVLALGESYNDNISISFSVGAHPAVDNEGQNNRSESQSPTPPGIDLFKQGLRLLQVTHEEPTIEQVEALNLITFYCYSLNRRKAAYNYAGMAHRLATILGLSNTSKLAIAAAEQEHGKRVWWTTVCMELMTCTELSLRPACGLDRGRCLELPSSDHLSFDDKADFSEPQYLNAQIQLCRIKYRVTQAICELRSGSLEEAHNIINPCLEHLRQWRQKFDMLSLEFSESGKFSTSTLGHPQMRTIASIILRYNHCYILLLRPMLLRELYSIIQAGGNFVPNMEITELNNECLRAATDNASIQSALSQCHKLAKFGFWESLHIFSSLTIIIISTFLAENCPAAISFFIERNLFFDVRKILEEMAHLGNNASKDHERMIQDIENLFPTGGVYAGLPHEGGDFIEWSDYLGIEDSGFDFNEPLGSILGTDYTV